jgi:hypothetical protein
VISLDWKYLIKVWTLIKDIMQIQPFEYFNLPNYINLKIYLKKDIKIEVNANL